MSGLLFLRGAFMFMVVFCGIKVWLCLETFFDACTRLLPFFEIVCFGAHTFGKVFRVWGESECTQVGVLI